MPDFVTLTLVVNVAQVVLLPLIAGGLWWITAAGAYIGAEYKNRWWENVVMAVLFLLAVVGAFGSVRSVMQQATQPATASPAQAREQTIAALQDLGAKLVREQGEVVSVDLSATQVTDQSLQGIANLVSLQTLDLSQTGVSDFGLFHLKSLTNLQQLNLRNTRVTRTGADTLGQSLPECEIAF